MRSVSWFEWLASLGSAGGGGGACVTVLATVYLVAFVVKQIMVSQPTIEWHAEDHGGKIDFPNRPARK